MRHSPAFDIVVGAGSRGPDRVSGMDGSESSAPHQIRRPQGGQGAARSGARDVTVPLFVTYGQIVTTDIIAEARFDSRRRLETCVRPFASTHHPANAHRRILADCAVPTAHEEDALYVPRSCSARRAQAFSPQVL